MYIFHRQRQESHYGNVYKLKSACYKLVGYRLKPGRSKSFIVTLAVMALAFITLTVGTVSAQDATLSPTEGATCFTCCCCCPIVFILLILVLIVAVIYRLLFPDKTFSTASTTSGARGSNTVDATAKVYCKNCGALVDTSASYCPYCGTNLRS